MANPVFLDRNEADRRIVRARTTVRLRGRPRRQGRLPVGRLAAARRDPQGALPRRQDPRPRRADRGPDAAGDRGDLRGPAPPRRRGPQHRLHQPQALRGPRDRRPDHGHPARQGRRPADPVRDQRGGPRRADGRPRGLARPSIAASPTRPDAVLGVEGLIGQGRPRAGGRPRHRPRGPRRRDPRHRRRRRQRPGRAGRGARRAAQAGRRDGHARRQGHHRPRRHAMSTARASPTSRPTAIGSAWSCRSRSRTTWS